MELRGQWGWIRLNASILFFKKLYTKLPPETVQSVFLSNQFVTSCTSPSSTKKFFTKERNVDGSLIKLITLCDNTFGICQTYGFSIFSAIFDTVFCKSSRFSCSNISWLF